MSITSTLFLQIVVFLILGGITMKFVWPPLIKAIEDRQAKIAAGLAAADRGDQSLKDAQIKIAALETEARARAAEIVSQTEKRATAIVDEARVAARAEGERLMKAAHDEIQQEMNRARETLRDQVATLAVAGAEQILRSEIDAGKHQALLAQLKSQL
ncbi:F0F1 ATP synthase subunit B [soil metagenome]